MTGSSKITKIGDGIVWSLLSPQETEDWFNENVPDSDEETRAVVKQILANSQGVISKDTIMAFFLNKKKDTRE